MVGLLVLLSRCDPPVLRRCQTLALQGVEGGAAWGMLSSAFKDAGHGGQVTHASATSPPHSLRTTHTVLWPGECSV